MHARWLVGRLLKTPMVPLVAAAVFPGLCTGAHRLLFLSDDIAAAPMLPSFIGLVSRSTVPFSSRVLQVRTFARAETI
jgi:hypothetical protein